MVGQENTLIEPRQLCPETALAGAKLLIAAPNEPKGQAAAERLRAALAQYGEAVALADPPETLLREAHAPVFILGNLANSRCVRALYYHFLCATDCCYPGPGGYELRTLRDPLATGANLIHLGYSDAAGLEAGMEKLLNRLQDPLPPLQELHITRLPLPANEVKSITSVSLPVEDWQTANSVLGDQKGYLGYLTGNKVMLADCCRAWEAILACGYAKNEKIVQTHLFMLSHVAVWRLLEQTGQLPDHLRAPILRFIYQWAESEDGIGHIQAEVYQAPHYPRQNHGLIPALALVFAAEYFTAHYPRLEAPRRWKEAADRVFAPYGESWKPICDGLCHGWWLSQPVMLEYALLDPAHRYFEEGGARRAADCALAVVNNQGWMPSAGDADIPRAFPGPSLRIAAAYYRDGRYRYAYERAPENVRNRWLGGMLPPRAFDVGVAPVPPAPGDPVTVTPMDPLIYHVWERDPGQAAGATDTPPTAPLERCFDKLAVRAGWEEADDYLLLDGLGGGSHSYADAASILDYARFGVSCIVAEDNFIWSAPENHSQITVTRDGAMGAIPSFAALEARETDAEGNVYLRIRLDGCAGADWVREVFFRPGRCVVFRDTVQAQEAGEYAVEAHFRTPADAQLEGNCLRSARQSRSKGAVEFRLLSLCEPEALRAEAVPMHLRYRNLPDEKPASPADDAVAAWKSRYQTDTVALTAYAARAAGKLRPGDCLTLTHLAQIRAAEEPELQLRAEGNQLFLSDGKEHWQLQAWEAPRPARFQRATGGTAAAPQPERIGESSAPITALTPLPEGGAAFGAADGSLAALDAAGNTRWRQALEGPVYDLSAVAAPETLLAVGHGAAGLTAFDGSGKLQWRQTIRREPCPWPWWELQTPAAVQVAGGVFAGEPFFAVGCGDIQVRLFDAAGAERWMWRYNEGVPGRIRVGDVDGDGVPEIIVGGDILSDTACCRVLTHQRELKAQLTVEWWTSCLTAVSWAKAGGMRLIACGATRGRNLHLYDLSGMAGGEPPRQLFETRLGGSVTGLAFDCDSKTLLVATSQGFLLGLSFTGEKRWQRLFAQGITHLFAVGSTFLVVERDGRIHWLNAAGEALASGAVGLPWSCAVPTETGVCFTSGTGLYRLDRP